MGGLTPPPFVRHCISVWAGWKYSTEFERGAVYLLCQSLFDARFDCVALCEYSTINSLGDHCGDSCACDENVLLSSRWAEGDTAKFKCLDVGGDQKWFEQILLELSAVVDIMMTYITPRRAI